MSIVTATNRPLTFEVQGASSSAAPRLELEKLSGTEALSELFRFQLDLRSATQVDFSTVLGQPATVTVNFLGAPNEERNRNIRGIVSRLAEGNPIYGANKQVKFFRYRAELVPALWRLTRRVQSRIFQNLSVPDILKKVLADEWRLNVKFNWVSAYPPRVYCVQYRESDFAFVSRLMEDEGIGYYFDQQSEDNLVVTDGASNFPRLGLDPNIVYQEVLGGRHDGNVVVSWEKNQEVCAPQYTLRDYNFEKPACVMARQTKHGIESVKAGGVDHLMNNAYLANGKQMLEIVEDPSGLGSRFDTVNKDGQVSSQETEKLYPEQERLLKVRSQEELSRSLSIQGAGCCARFAPGFNFNLVHPSANADGRYVLTRVEHKASLEDAPSVGAEVNILYENTFQCIPVGMPYRPPRRTVRPRIEGTQTATVVGTAGAEVFTDKYGRVKVHFHWDLQGQKDGSDSCWIRVGTPWAGKNWGMIHIPRVGQEVIVDFQDGDPDRPIVVGSVHNAEQMPLLNLPDQAQSSGLKTQTVGGKPGEAHGLIFTDVKGSELIALSSQKDVTVEAKNNYFAAVPNELTVNVGAEMFNVVGLSFPGFGDFSAGMQTVFGGNRFDVTRGTNLTADGLLSNHYTLFSRNEVVIDPTTWLSALFTGTWTKYLLMGKVPSGRSEAVYGNRVTLGFGPRLWAQHGPFIQRLAASETWLKVFAATHAAGVAANASLPFLYQLTHLAALKTAITPAELVAAVSHAMLNTFERKYATAKAAANAAETVLELTRQRLSSWAPSALFRHELDEYTKFAADVLRTSSIVNHQEVGGIYSLQADRIQMLGGAGGISLIAKDKPIFLDSKKGTIGLAAGKAGIGLYGDNQNIKILTGSLQKSVGIQITPNSVQIATGAQPQDPKIVVFSSGVVIKKGDNSKITLTDNALTLKVGQASLELKADGSITAYGNFQHVPAH